MPPTPLVSDDLGGDLFDLGMSEQGKPLLERVKKFIETEIEPKSE